MYLWDVKCIHQEALEASKADYSTYHCSNQSGSNSSTGVSTCGKTSQFPMQTVRNRKMLPNHLPFNSVLNFSTELQAPRETLWKPLCYSDLSVTRNDTYIRKWHFFLLSDLIRSFLGREPKGEVEHNFESGVPELINPVVQNSLPRSQSLLNTRTRQCEITADIKD